MAKDKKKPNLSDIFEENMEDEFPEEEEDTGSDLEEEVDIESDFDNSEEEDDSDFGDDEEDDDEPEEEDDLEEEDDDEPEEEPEPEKEVVKKPAKRAPSQKRKTTSSKSKKKTKAKSTKKSPKKSTKKGTLSLDFSDVDEGVLRVAPSGTVDSRFPINAYKASKGRKDRIAILDDRVMIAKVHYVKGVGYFHCFDGKCCEDGFANTRYIYLIIRYDTSSKGKVVSTDYEIQFLNLPQMKYDLQIVPRVEDDEDITATDMRVICTESDKQQYQLQALSDAYWKTDKFDTNQIMEDAQNLVRHVSASVARKMTESQYEEDVLGVTVDSDDDYDELDDLQ